MVELVRWDKKFPPTEAEIVTYFSGESLSPHRWSNYPGYEYPVHDHQYTKVLFCLKGSIDFKNHSDGKVFDLKPGDKIAVSAGTGHSAIAGESGVTCIEAPKY